MLLIHTPRLTNRIGYTLNVVFKHILHEPFGITTDNAYYETYDGPKMNYGPKKIGDGVYVRSVNLLFETSIEEQDVRPCQIDGQWHLFPVFGKETDMPSDILAATFFMTSRYEEYLPHREDEHGRFNATESIAYQSGFLEEPVVEQWAMMLHEKIERRYPGQMTSRRNYRFELTVDIDSAWCYLHKGFFRTVAGTMRDLMTANGMQQVGQRWRVLTHREADPFDTFDYIIGKYKTTAMHNLIFFALLADYDQYDKPSNSQNPHMRELLQHLGDHAKMGIHPGYYTMEHPSSGDMEIKRLEQILHRTIVRSRFHFLRLKLPHSYRILLHNGVRHDYTMGYPDKVGFRAGMSAEYPFYDLERDIETTLTIHPFCAMDTTMRLYMKATPQEAIEKYRSLIDSIRAVGGTYCSIVHNQNMSEKDGWGGWREVFEAMVDYASDNEAR